MITTIHMENYGPFRQAEMRLGGLTVIVGPNASGKSTTLDALLRLTLGDYSGVFEYLQRSDTAELEFRYEDSSGGQCGVAGAAKNRRSVDRLKTRDYQAISLELEPNRLREPSYIDSSEPMLAPDGYGLATTLAYLKLGDSESFQAIEEQTRRVVPTFEQVRFKRAKVRPRNGQGEPLYGDELILDMRDAKGLSHRVVSDGTILTLGILTSTIVRARRTKDDEAPLVFLIDELERGLHPRALKELVGALRGLAESTGVQIVATSHSPYLLDALSPDEVRLTGFLDDGSATIRELTDHPDFERWKEEMTPGEFWSMVGEDWIR